jgi:hypothetical protein
MRWVRDRKATVRTTEDRMVRHRRSAMSQRAGSKVTEVAASHSVFLSQPTAVALSSSKHARPNLVLAA